MAATWVYDFAEGPRQVRELLGGKGANVAEMTRVLGAERGPGRFAVAAPGFVAHERLGWAAGRDDA